jgi:hypothetical protein
MTSVPLDKEIILTKIIIWTMKTKRIVKMVMTMNNNKWINLLKTAITKETAH